MHEHKNKIFDGFTKKYYVDKLVYFEKHLTPEDAMKREKQLKKWNRNWKIELIEKCNPDWKDLFSELTGILPQEKLLDSLLRGN